MITYGRKTGSPQNETVVSTYAKHVLGMHVSNFCFLKNNSSLFCSPPARPRYFHKVQKREQKILGCFFHCMKHNKDSGACWILKTKTAFLAIPLESTTTYSNTVQPQLCKILEYFHCLMTTVTAVTQRGKESLKHSIKEENCMDASTPCIWESGLWKSPHSFQGLIQFTSVQNWSDLHQIKIWISEASCVSLICTGMTICAEFQNCSPTPYSIQEGQSCMCY